MKSNTSKFEENYINELIKRVDKSTFICFDWDYTLIKSTSHFGSEKWEKEIKNSFIVKGMSEKEATIRAIDHWQEAQKTTTIEWNSQLANKIFFEITKITNKWSILTARSEQIKDVTIDQMKKSLDFENDLHHDRVASRFIFCGGKNKGEILKEFFKKNKDRALEKIIVFDDKSHNINAIKIHFNTFHVIGIDLNEKDFLL